MGSVSEYFRARFLGVMSEGEFHAVLQHPISLHPQLCSVRTWRDGRHASFEGPSGWLLGGFDAARTGAPYGSRVSAANGLPAGQADL